MARDLSFWKAKKNARAKNSDIYRELSNGSHLDCIYDIPSAQIMEDIICEFANWEQISPSFFENGGESFQLYITRQFVRADCYNVTELNMNRIIDIMLKYGCKLYDSTIDVRFDEDNDN